MLFQINKNENVQAMSYSTDLWCCISFSGRTYNNKDDVERDLDEVRRELYNARETISRLVFMTEPQKFYRADGESVADQLNYELESAFEALEECHCKELQLIYLLDNWDACHKDGKAIKPPKGIDCCTAFLDGDFIK